MRQLVPLTLLTVLLFGTLANARCPSGCLFYGGDLNPSNPRSNALGNETDLYSPGIPYGVGTYQNFINSQTWNITGLFTNNLSTLTPSGGYWEIRSGMSEGNGGTLIASGTGSGGNFSQTPTGRSDFGDSEYTDLVSGLNVNLPSGMYWLAMVPSCPTCEGRSFNSNSLEGLNAVGTQVSDDQFWNDSLFNNFSNADDVGGGFPTFSSGVLGTEIPEPSSMVMLAPGLGLVVARVVRRR